MNTTHLRCLGIELRRLDLVQDVHSSSTLKDPFTLELLLVLVPREGDTVESDVLDALRDKIVEGRVEGVCSRRGDERSQVLLGPSVQWWKDDSGSHYSWCWY